MFPVTEMNNSLQIIQIFLDHQCRPGMVAVDATAGNGHDTLLLSTLAGAEGRVYAFDVQKQAIENSALLLQEHAEFDNVSLIHDSHEQITTYVHEPVDLVLFNLGFLPGGDKTVTTLGSSTINAVKSSISILKKNGLILIVCYHGHKNGADERAALEEYLKNLDQKSFNVGMSQFINQKNAPPLLFFVQKR